MPKNQNPPRWLILATIIALIAFVVFAASLALSTFRQRVAPAQQAWTPAPTRGPLLTVAPVARVTQAAATATPTALVATATPDIATPTPVMPTETPIEIAPPTPTETPSVTLPPTPCGIPLALELSDLYSRMVFGCPTGDTAVVWAAWETFERGALLWRSDTDTAYAFLVDGRWYPIATRWGGDLPPGRGEPPAGLLAPERGFGWVWGTNDTLYADLGWATDAEKGFCAQVQPVERGFLLRSSAVASCTAENLYNHATAPGWQPVVLAAFADGWSVTRPPDVILPQGVPSRPARQGLFPAPRLTNISLDGSPDEWPGPWLLLTAIVEGAAAWTDEADLSGVFQVAWNEAGLYLTVQVTDDRYRAGPSDTDMWQGDSLEINFDRVLAGDFASIESNDDDYQVGISYGPDLALMLGYRWLPFYEEEGPLDLSGAAVATADGYTVETLIPWEVFGLTPDNLTSGMTFGFNVALNDNDSNAPVQETVAAASPARMTYDDPTQWGTLVLK